MNQREETEQGATGAERGQDKGGTGKGWKKGERQEEGGRERKREQEKGSGQKGEKGRRGPELLLKLLQGPRLGFPPPSPVHWCERSQHPHGHTCARSQIHMH